MLKIPTVRCELFDSISNQFFYIDPFTARLEHSLISISKWEAHYKKSFLPSRTSTGISTVGEELYYINCMSINELPLNGVNVLFTMYDDLIKDYISDSQTATTISHIGDDNSLVKKTVTSELVYYWMIEFNIPTEFEKWHFNRLLTLIDLCNAKRQESTGKGKMSALESAQHRHALNKMRRGQP